MGRAGALLVAVAMVVAACSGQAAPSEQSTESTAEAPATSGAATESTVDGATSSTGGGGDAPATTDSGRPRAPDFTLALGDGGTYTLPSGEKPVYMVFWAEW